MGVGRIIKFCGRCNKEFNVIPSEVSRRFCSRQCYYDSMKTKIIRICKVCDNVFYVQPHRIKLGRGKYCSRKCFNRHQLVEIFVSCNGCEKDFYAFVPLNDTKDRYCSLDCYYSSIRKDKIKCICKWCKDEFDVYPSTIKNGNGKYCSKKCSGLGRQKREIVICEFCAVAFECRISSNQRFCSNTCYDKSKQNKIPRICKYCNKSFDVWPSTINAGNGIYCSAECKIYGNSGSGHYNWKGGISSEPYSLEFNDEFKKLIRIRDNYTCQLCGKLEMVETRSFDVHHIDYNKKNSVLENCITLCRSCHCKTNYSREYWKELFTPAGILVVDDRIS